MCPSIVPQLLPELWVTALGIHIKGRPTQHIAEPHPIIGNQGNLGGGSDQKRRTTKVRCDIFKYRQPTNILMLSLCSPNNEYRYFFDIFPHFSKNKSGARRKTHCIAFLQTGRWKSFSHPIPRLVTVSGVKNLFVFVRCVVFQSLEEALFRWKKINIYIYKKSTKIN